MVDINENQPIPTSINLNCLTISPFGIDGNTNIEHIHAYTPHQCFYLSFDMAKGISIWGSPPE
jgi:hypothetical protein